jgi:hypothetical protein
MKANRPPRQNHGGNVENLVDERPADRAQQELERVGRDGNRVGDGHSRSRQQHRLEHEAVDLTAVTHFTTKSVTSTLVTSPLTLSVALVNCADWPSLRIIESFARNDRKDGWSLDLA